MEIECQEVNNHKNLPEPGSQVLGIDIGKEHFRVLIKFSLHIE